MPTLRRILRRLSEGAARARRDQSGAIAVQFALLVIPLAVIVFALVDLGRISLQRRQMQDALDAATLIAARSTATTDAEMEAVGDPAFLAEVASLNLGLSGANAKFTAGADNHIIGTATAKLKPVIANLWTRDDFTVTATSDVVRSSKNLEVALVLDITGSMKGTRITDLKTAASDLVDIIVKDNQVPFYSKVALVPYAAGVNVGTYADAARGPVPVRAISGAAWLASAKSITGVSKANPAVVTVVSHGFATGDKVYISGITGNMSGLNSKTYTITKVNADSFSLQNTSTSTFGNYSSGGGQVRKCLTSACSIVVTTSTAHGFITNDQISFAGMAGLTTLNGSTRTITNLTATTFDTGVIGGSTTGTYTSGGAATCEQSANPGCNKLAYTSASNTSEVRGRSSCVSERTGADAYTDAAPSTAFVGTNYPSYLSADTNSPNPCPGATITPLSSDRTTLKNQITALSEGGSTAGQIGLAWGWYMVAPNFGYLWPNPAQRPAAYRSKDLLKFVILMTDGAFNTPYCKGVIALDAGSGSGNSSDHINCAATNGAPFVQSRALCKAIKDPANGVIVYTVGFDVGSDATAKSFLTDCASDSSKAFFPANGSELKTAFKAIAQEISELRIAK
ncbi:ubiquitin-activating E1 FCCH domain-containing protein [Caulobacter sp. RL271]|jgi:Flp pilus assembly protein TadG|uniref:Pilus assembly protein TadG-related protein n=1 Tax=Caulobacter segnis TaxID=88688 RepID=A0ABY4ZT06_9CAUL|nr:ubiquitin-activating E1 FCCH domain-containing protein [Caulobacter segnis]USQ95726.1 pilus assembly protein TadG-related protein [Caulobacter segnis]